jgi:hypothetical protein
VVHYTISVEMVLLTGVMRIPSLNVCVDDRVCEWVLAYLSVLIGGREGSVVAGINKRMHEDIRRRALRKAAKSK